MNIIKYKKTGKNKYNILLSNNQSITLYEDIILKYELLLKKEIENIDEILEENKEYEVYDNVLSYINKRIRCEKEIKDYLIKKNISENQINNIINTLKSKNLLDEANYVRSYTNDKFNLNGYGPNKIKNELLNLEIDENVINDNLIINKEELYDKLNKLIDKKLTSLKKYTGKILKYKVEVYFINMGYDKEIIDEILDNKTLNKDNYDEEYKKLYEKYSKKYSGYELEVKVKQKLYQKGYIK